MNIYESIAAIQADVDFIGKEKTTQSGAKFKYRGVDQVLNTLHPLFAKHKVFAVPEVLGILTRETRETNNGNNVLYQVLKVKYTFYAEDGTNVEAIVVGEAMDSGDKASNKCMSVAYKYACFQVLSIPTEETTQDPDEQNEELAPKKSSRKAVANIREEFSKKISDIGISDVTKTVAWFEEKYEKPLEQFSSEEISECIAWAKGRVERKKREAENA